jgi:hypothetical protein
MEAAAGRKRKDALVCKQAGREKDWLLLWVFLETVFHFWFANSHNFAKADQPASMNDLSFDTWIVVDVEKRIFFVGCLFPPTREVRRKRKSRTTQGEDELFTIWASPSSPSTERKDQHRRP